MRVSTKPHPIRLGKCAIDIRYALNQERVGQERGASKYTQ